MPRIAVLDDYQGVALRMADWSVLAPDCRVQVFTDHFEDIAADLRGTPPLRVLNPRARS